MEISTSTEIWEERIQRSIMYISGLVNRKETKKSYEISGEKNEFGYILYDIFTTCEDINITEETIMTAWKTLKIKLNQQQELDMGSMGDIILNMCQLISQIVTLNFCNICSVFRMSRTQKLALQFLISFNSPPNYLGK